MLAGIVEGIGPLAGPTDVRVDTPDKARAAVDWYADHGYAQIKIYSSFSPALVATVADLAHARGLRVSGHVPASFARAFVEAGADEIQHLNFILLNFFPDVKDTRSGIATRCWPTSSRSSISTRPLRRLHHLPAPAPHRAGSDAVGARGPVLRRARACAPACAPMVAALPAGGEAPPAVRRRGRAGRQAGRLRAGAAGRCCACSSAARRWRHAHAGHRLFAGYSLHRELELYAQAGIPRRGAAHGHAGAGAGAGRRPRRTAASSRRASWPTWSWSTATRARHGRHPPRLAHHQGRPGLRPGGT